MTRAVVRIDDMYTIDPLTNNQTLFFTEWNSHHIFVLHGCAGTGKSFIALYKALEDVLDKANVYEKVVIVRSAVPSRDIGALPGDLEEKGEVYELPYVEMTSSLFNKQEAYSRLKEQKKLQFVLSSYVRGITLDNSIIIVDEIQNMNYQELHTIITRVGVNSKIVFCGDLKQNDINGKSGLDRFLNILDNMPSPLHIEFGVEDIVRSDLVKEFLIAENKYESRN